MPNIEWAAAWCGQDRNGVFFLSFPYVCPEPVLAK
jgi:hypothetical protein